MKIENKNIISAIKKMKPADFIYLVVFFILFTITIIIFIISTKSIITRVNKIFIQNEETSTQILDTAKYKLLEKKLNLPTNK